MTEAPHSHPELFQLPEDLRETVGELVESMPDNSWAIEQTSRLSTSRRSPFFSLRSELRDSQSIVDKFLDGNVHGRLSIVTPTTMAIGLYLGGRSSAAISYGLFSYPEDSRYNPNLVKEALKGKSTDVVLHGRVDLRVVTGREHGTVSPVLAKQHLRNFEVVDFDSSLTHKISEPATVVAYPLGGNDLLYFCARGADFLDSYRTFVNNLGIRNNLGDSPAQR